MTHRFQSFVSVTNATIPKEKIYGPFISRNQAIEQGLKFYFNGNPCKHGHMSMRLVCDWSCYECKKSNSRKSMREAYRSDPAAAKKKSEQRRKNPAAHRASYQRYKKKNPAYIVSLTLKRRGKLHNKWSNLTKEEKKRMRAIYVQVEQLNKEAGYGAYHVDHIQPVARGGKHHPDNLQILTAEENQRKWAKWDEDSDPAA